MIANGCVVNAAECHGEAMVLAKAGDALKLAGKDDEACVSFAMAMELERHAALMISEEHGRGIMLRSAAWLALAADRPPEAERLAAIGLSAPALSERVANELRAVMQAAWLGIEAIGADLQVPRLRAARATALVKGLALTPLNESQVGATQRAGISDLER